MNFRLKLWNIKEIGNTLTASSIVSIVVRGKIWSKIFREASMNKLLLNNTQISKIQHNLYIFHHEVNSVVNVSF